MAQKASPLADILAALPAVQAEVRAMIAARIAAGEAIGRVEGNRIISTHPTTCDLAELRKEILENHAIDGLANGTERHSIA
jgi:hypothetical protein